MTTSAPPPDDRVATYLERVGLAQRSTVIALKGDASERRYVRVILSDGSSLMVLVHSGPIDPATLPFLNVARLLQQMSVPIPRVRDVAADLGILVLDDLGDLTLQAALPAASPDQRRALYAEAVTMIADVRAPLLQHALSRSPPTGASRGGDGEGARGRVSSSRTRARRRTTGIVPS